MSCCVGCCCELWTVFYAAAVAWAAVAVVSVDVFGLAVDAAAVVLATVTVKKAVLADVVELPAAASAAVALTSLPCSAVTVYFAVELCC